MRLPDRANVEDGCHSAKGHAYYAEHPELRDLVGDAGEKDQSQSEDENVGSVSEAVAVDDHLVTLSLTVAELIDDGQMRDLNGSPTDVENSWEGQVPGILEIL